MGKISMSCHKNEGMTTNPEPVGPMSGDGDVGSSAIVGVRIHVERVVTHLV